MPWKETCVMDQKIQMISNWVSGEYSISELSRIHAISRKTLYKWIERYQADRDSGLQERSSRPVTMPRATPAELVAEILTLKNRHEHWGSRKLLAWLTSHQPERCWPAASTTNEILKRHGLVKSRRKRHHTPPYSEPFLKCNQPNEVWCADFKGQFRLGSGSLCYPLTITDSYSRYLLGCWGLAHPAYLPTRSFFELAFREYGLPSAIRTDNGVPFASVGLGGLSSLGVWFVKLGIRPERIEKGHPEQNGRHERMHRTLKGEAISPPRKNMAEQQRAFERFQRVYNNDRPHEALGQKAPMTIYRRSAREYPPRLSEIEYPQSYSLRQVKENGCFKWQNEELYISGTLAGELIGFKPIDNGIWKIYFSFYPLGTLEERTLSIKSS
jgi:transposase InsO family protein